MSRSEFEILMYMYPHKDRKLEGAYSDPREPEIFQFYKTVMMVWKSHVTWYCVITYHWDTIFLAGSWFVFHWHWTRTGTLFDSPSHRKIFGSPSCSCRPCGVAGRVADAQEERYDVRGTWSSPGYSGWKESVFPEHFRFSSSYRHIRTYGVIHILLQLAWNRSEPVDRYYFSSMGRCFKLTTVNYCQ